MVIKNELFAGVAVALAMFILLCLEFIFGLHDRYIDYYLYIENIIYILPVIGLYLAIKKRYYLQPPGEFQIKDGLMSGVIVCVTAAFLNLPLQLLFLEYINPDYFGNMIAVSAKKAITSGGNSIIAIQEAQNYYNQTDFLIQGFTTFIILGLFISMMVSFRLVKKDTKAKNIK